MFSLRLIVMMTTVSMVTVTRGEVYSSVTDMIRVFQLERDLGNRGHSL
jgi:hypothetical protein